MMLKGIRIVDMTTVVFGPYATQMLADLGADVIKVEAPGGDISRLLGRARTTPDMGSIHMTLNRGKRSIVLDAKKPDDADVLRKLLATADVFFHNVRAKAIGKLGFGFEDVKAIKPDIIYVHGAGFAQEGPYADLQAYDDVIQAASGTTTLLPRVDGNPAPRYFPSLIADKVAGHYGAQAILAALVHKLRTGEGQHVEVPMLEAFTMFTMCEHLRDAVFEPPMGEAGYPRQLDPARQPFPTSDGHISIVPYTDDQQQMIFHLMGAPEVLEMDELKDMQLRFRNSTVLYNEIAKRTPQKTSAEWIAIFRAAKIPTMVVRDLNDVVNDPHLVATDFFHLRDHPDSGKFREMRPPVRYSANTGGELGFAPKLDQHGAEIRKELGL